MSTIGPEKKKKTSRSYRCGGVYIIYYFITLYHSMVASHEGHKNVTFFNATERFVIAH